MNEIPFNCIISENQIMLVLFEILFRAFVIQEEKEEWVRNIRVLLRITICEAG